MFESAGGRIANWALREAVQQAIELAAGQKLPVSARSLPASEVRGKGCMLGAIVLLRRWPDPDPLVFGYHEIWHVMVVAASLCHYAAVMWIVLTF